MNLARNSLQVAGRVTMLVLAVAFSLSAQDETETAENPLAALKEEVERAVEDAGLSFTESQDSAIILMMEDRRQASEELFGDLMDFSAGPTQGQEADSLRSAIEWMRNEFLTRLEDYLTEPQFAAWSRYLETSELEVGEGPTRNDQEQQTQYVRIYNNIFTAEEDGYQFGQRRPEVTERGGYGAFHGNFQFLIKDESLNAGRRSYSHGQRVATVKPPYQERDTSFDVSGPVLPARLTMSFSGGWNDAENVETINATLADGSAFSREIVRPTNNRWIAAGGTYQLAENHSLTFNIGHAPFSSENQGIGGFTLPERAWTTEGSSHEFEVKQFSRLSPDRIYEMRFLYGKNHEETIPVTDGVRIDVVEAFSSGGSQNSSEVEGRTYEFGNLYSDLGERLTIRTGIDGVYRRNRAFSTANFDGTFTFSSLDDFNAGQPFQYRAVSGEPLLETSQLELSFFVQNDWSVTPELTLYLGARYNWQTNLNDRDNIAPRLGFAYALGQATVIRGGGGFFYNRLPINLVEDQRRLDGTRQVETVIDQPAFPDPFQSGTVQNLLPSVRVTDPTLSAPYVGRGTISIERTFLTNLFLSAAYEYWHEVHRIRLRDINAPHDTGAADLRSCTPGQSADTCIRQDPTKQNILNLESSAAEVHHSFRLSYRQRFTLFNVSANYQFQRAYADTAPNAIGVPAADSHDLRAEWGSAGVFPTHTFGSTVNAQMPLGIFLAGTMSTDSGRRYNITTGTDDNQDGFLTDRPAGVARNAGDGPKVLTFSFNVSKAFFFEPAGGGGGTRTNLNVFANVTNAFNNVNLSMPSGVMTSPNFGRSTSASNPREIEAGLRFQF